MLKEIGLVLAIIALVSALDYSAGAANIRTLGLFIPHGSDGSLVQGTLETLVTYYEDPDAETHFGPVFGTSEYYALAMLPLVQYGQSTPYKVMPVGNDGITFPIVASAHVQTSSSFSLHSADPLNITISPRKFYTLVWNSNLDLDPYYWNPVVLVEDTDPVWNSNSSVSANLTLQVRLFNGIGHYPNPIELLVNGTVAESVGAIHPTNISSYAQYEIGISPHDAIVTISTSFAVRDSVTKTVLGSFSLPTQLGDTIRYALTIWIAGIVPQSTNSTNTNSTVISGLKVFYTYDSTYAPSPSVATCMSPQPASSSGLSKQTLIKYAVGGGGLLVLGLLIGIAIGCLARRQNHDYMMVQDHAHE